jgi:hypothetical protein
MLRGDMGTIRYEPGGAVDSQGWRPGAPEALLAAMLAPCSADCAGTGGIICRSGRSRALRNTAGDVPSGV